jgi:hypothetical protein
VSALAALARERGCYGMWVPTDEHNAAALAAYHRAGGVPEGEQVMLEWTFGTLRRSRATGHKDRNR